MLFSWSCSSLPDHSCWIIGRIPGFIRWICSCFDLGCLWFCLDSSWCEPLDGTVEHEKRYPGEERVAWELSYLSDEFLLLNDVMLPGSKGNLDHVVVGPTGVFIVETKNYSGMYACYGDRWFFQRIRQKYDISSVSVQARNNARVLADLLHESGFTVDVSPVMVFTHPSVQLWLHGPTVQNPEKWNDLQLSIESTPAIPTHRTLFPKSR